MEIQLIIDLVALCLILILFLRLGCTIVTIHGDSMSPTLVTGDRLLVFKLFPRLWLRKGKIVIGKTQQLDELSFLDAQVKTKLLEGSSELVGCDIALATPEIEQTTIVDEASFEETCSSFVKRVVGLPGDTICIGFNTLSEPMQALLQHQCDLNGQLIWVVPEKHYFLRGDGVISMDSLLLGPVALSTLTGVAIAKLPRNHLPTLHPSNL